MDEIQHARDDVMRAWRAAGEHYTKMLQAVRYDYEHGLVDTDTSRPDRQEKGAWIAAETRRRLLAELDDETPYREDLRPEPNWLRSPTRRS